MTPLESIAQSITLATDILIDHHFSHDDFVLSLQGPAIILTTDGQKKITEGIRKELEKVGMRVLG